MVVGKLYQDSLWPGGTTGQIGYYKLCHVVQEQVKTGQYDTEMLVPINTFSAQNITNSNPTHAKRFKIYPATQSRTESL